MKKKENVECQVQILIMWAKAEMLIKPKRNAIVIRRCLYLGIPDFNATARFKVWNLSKTNVKSFNSLKQLYGFTRDINIELPI